MKLLYPEVDIVPGRPGQRPQVTPVREEQPLPGSAVIRLTNPTSQENAFTVRLRCEQPFWQDGWYTVVALPPGQGAENAPPPGKPDQRGPQDRWVKIYVPRGGARDVLIRFNVPPRPESRAGRYQYTVEVETQVIGPTPGGEAGRRKDRVSQVPGVAVVRPFYKWSVDLSPEERRVGRRHRSGDFEVVVTNEGNDWLYCDLHLPRPKDVQVEAPTLRLAVPPPEPGETLPPLPGGTEQRAGTQRTAPLSAATKLKIFRGSVTRQPLPVSAQRVDAPSVPPPAGDGYAGLGAVVAVATTESQQAPADRALVYYPPVPDKFTDFFSKGASSIRTMAFGLIGLAAAIVMGIVLYQNMFYEGVKVEPQSLTAAPGKPLLIAGQFLQGCKFYMGDKTAWNTKSNWIPVDYRLDPFHPNRMTIKEVPPELDHKMVKIKAQRFVYFLPFLTDILPSKESKSIVQVGSLVQAAAAPTADPVNPGPYKPGSQITITGQNLGDHGAVLINNLKAKTFWSANKITATVSPSAQAGAVLPVVVQPEGSTTALQAGSIQIAAAPVVVVHNNTNGGNTNGGSTNGGNTNGGSTNGGGTNGGSTNGGSTNGGTTDQQKLEQQKRLAQQRLEQQRIEQQKRLQELKKQQIQNVVHIPRPVLGTPPYALLLNGSYPQAVGAAKDILAKKPNDGAAYALEAIGLIKMGQIDAARGPANAALRVTNGQTSGRPRALALVAQGLIYEADNNKNAATQSYQSAGNTDQTLVLTYLVFADLLHKNNQNDLAKRMLQTAQSQNPSPAESAAISAKLNGM